MCRYATHDYLTHHVCLPCRRAFKAPAGARRCPECGAPGRQAGHDFHAPGARTGAPGVVGELLQAGVKL